METLHENEIHLTRWTVIPSRSKLPVHVVLSAAVLKITESNTPTRGREHIIAARGVSNNLLLLPFYVLGTYLSNTPVHIPTNKVIKHGEGALMQVLRTSGPYRKEPERAQVIDKLAKTRDAQMEKHKNVKKRDEKLLE